MAVWLSKRIAIAGVGWILWKTMFVGTWFATLELRYQTSRAENQLQDFQEETGWPWCHISFEWNKLSVLSSMNVNHCQSYEITTRCSHFGASSFWIARNLPTSILARMMQQKSWWVWQWHWHACFLYDNIWGWRLLIFQHRLDQQASSNLKFSKSCTTLALKADMMLGWEGASLDEIRPVLLLAKIWRDSCCLSVDGTERVVEHIGWNRSEDLSRFAPPKRKRDTFWLRTSSTCLEPLAITGL